MVRYRILHITTDTFIRKIKRSNYGNDRYPFEQFLWKWTADRFLRKLPEEFYFLNAQKQYVKVLKAELIVVPVDVDKFIGFGNG